VSGEIGMDVVLQGLALALLLSVVGGFYPAYRAAQANPTRVSGTSNFVSKNVKRAARLDSGGYGDQQTEIAGRTRSSRRACSNAAGGGREEVARIGYRRHHLIRAGTEHVRQALDKLR